MPRPNELADALQRHIEVGPVDMDIRVKKTMSQLGLQTEGDPPIEETSGYRPATRQEAIREHRRQKRVEKEHRDFNRRKADRYEGVLNGVHQMRDQAYASIMKMLRYRPWLKRRLRRVAREEGMTLPKAVDRFVVAEFPTPTYDEAMKHYGADLTAPWGEYASR